MASLHDRVADDVVTILKGLNLTSLPGGVERVGDIDALNMDLPAVLVSIHGEQETLLAGTTLTKQRGYPVRVMFVSRDEVSIEDEARIVEWREAAMNAFDRRSRTDGLVLPTCPEVWTTSVRPRPVLDENLGQYKYAVSGFIVEAQASIAR